MNLDTRKSLAWKGQDSWRYFLGLTLFFTLLQVCARILMELAFYRDSLSFVQGLYAHFYGLRFDLRIACLAAGVPLLAGAIPVLGKWLHPVDGQWFGANGRIPRFWPVLGAGAIGLWALAVYGDFGNMAYWQQRLNVGVLYLLADFKTNTKMVWDTYPVVWLSLLTCFLVVLGYRAIRMLAERTLSRQIAEYPAGSLSGPPRPLKSFLLNLGLCAVVLFLIHGRWSQYPLRWSDLVRIGHPPAEQLALNPVQNVVDTLAYRTPQFDLKATRAAYPLMSAWLKVDKPDAERLNFSRLIPARAEPVIPPNANVVLVIMESLSGYKTSMHGNKLDPTPELKKLADQGWWFSRFGSAHPLTARGVYSIVTSRPDVASGDTASRNPGAILHKSLVTSWKTHQPFYFIGGSTSWANVRGLLTKAIPGIKIYEEENFKTPRVDVWGLSDRNLFYESAGILDQHAEQSKSPFFAIIQTAANHRPYTIPPDDAEFKVLQKTEAEIAANGIGGGNEEYNAIRLMDHSVGKFLERARKSSWFDNTVFVFLGDHGTRGNVPAYMPAWMQGTEIAIMHTPLIMYSPKYLKPMRSETMGQQADLLPTLVDMSGLSAENRSMGRSLISDRPGQEGFFFTYPIGGQQYGWFDGRYYLRIDKPEGNERKSAKAAEKDPPQMQLYDLSDVSKHNLNVAAQHPEIVRRLGEQLEAYFQTARYSVLNP